MNTIKYFQNKVSQALSDSIKPSELYDLFREADELKSHLEDEHGLSPIEFNRIVGFTSEYKDKMNDF